jgi:hypothetical protein
MLGRIPRQRFLRFRRDGRIVSVTGALVIAAMLALFVEDELLWRHLVGVVLTSAWVLTVTWATKRRWLRWLRHDFPVEVNAKLDAIRCAAPFN